MNPLTNVKNINKLNEREAELGVSSKSSWHQQYSDSAYIFVGGLPYDLTEGDVICVFSQYGEIVNINLVRDKKTGKSKGFCFIAFEDQRSTILAVDNLNGIKLLGRTLRVDHVAEYRKPKEDDNDDDITKKLRQEGCAPRTPSPSSSEKEEETLTPPHKEKDSSVKRSKKKAKKEKKKKRKKEKNSSSSESDGEHISKQGKVKKEKEQYSRVKSEKYPNDNGGDGGEPSKQRYDRDSVHSTSDRDKNYQKGLKDIDRRGEGTSGRYREEDNATHSGSHRDYVRDRDGARDYRKDMDRHQLDKRDRDHNGSRNHDYKQERDRYRDRSRDSDRNRDSGRDRDRR